MHEHDGLRTARAGRRGVEVHAVGGGVQRLLQRGYVVLSVNYRGGIGYGVKFREALKLKMGVDDAVDVVRGGIVRDGIAEGTRVERLQ